MTFSQLIHRPPTVEQRIDWSLAKLAQRPLQHMTTEELRDMVAELKEEVQTICGKHWKRL